MQGLRYFLAGAATNIVVLGIYFHLSMSGWLLPVVALPVASFVGVAIGFAAQGLYTFRGNELHGAAFAKYAAIYVWSALFQWMFLLLFHVTLGFHHAAIVVIGLGSAAAMSFLLQRDWVFNARK